MDENLKDLMQDFEQGNTSPIPVTTYPITKAKDAFRFMAQGKHTGNELLIQLPVYAGLYEVRV